MKILPKFLFALFLLLPLALFLSSPSAHAQYSHQSFLEAISTDTYNKQKFDLQSFSGIINAGVTALGGCSEADCPTEVRTGAIQGVGTLTASLYSNPPASGVVYFAEMLDNLGISAPAYAQGAPGFEALSPVLPIWRAFRNFAYTLFIIVFVVIGLAIMFRFKLNPQTVITIQSAIPRIVIALLLVTFSYPIAGLMIDMVYVLISIVALIFGSANIPGVDAQGLQSQYTGSFFEAIVGVFGIVGPQLVGATITALFSAFLVTIVGGPFGTLLGIIGVGAGLIALILLIIVLYVLFKLFIELLLAYLSILIAVIFAPLQIALGVIPGFPGFGAWFKNLTANLLIFPAVAFILILGNVLTHAPQATQNLWQPPLFLGGIGSQLLPGIIGFGMLLIVHQVPKAIKSALGIKDVLGITPMETLMAGLAPAGFGYKATTQAATQVSVQGLAGRWRERGRGDGTTQTRDVEKPPLGGRG